MEAIVLAGGLGTRLREAVSDLPKPMAPVSGRPFLEYLLDYWIKQGVQEFVLSVAYKHEIIEKHFGLSYKGVPIKYAVDKGWGTGGGVAAALSQRDTVSAPFLVINGDTYFEVPLAEFRKFHGEKKAEASFALLEVPDASRFGRIVMTGDQKICSFEPPAPGRALINGGVYLFGPDFLKNAPQAKKFSLENDFFPQAVSSGRGLYGFPVKSRFKDIGTPDDYRAFSEFLNP